MLLTFTDSTMFNCLAGSSINEIIFTYDKTTFFATLDLFTSEKLNGAILENIDENNVVLSTEVINNAKIGNVKIDNINNTATIILSKMTAIERKLETLENNVTECINSIDNLIAVLFEE